MSYVLPLAACLTGQPGEWRDHYLSLTQIYSATARHLGGAVLLRDWIVDREGWRLTNVRCLPNSKVASAQN